MKNIHINTLSDINTLINNYLSNKNKIQLVTEEYKEIYGTTIQMIRLFEILSETNEICSFYSNNINSELIKFISISHIENNELNNLYTRKCSEWCLKWLCEIETGKRDITMGFRSIKEILLISDVYSKEKDKIDNILKVFSESSNVLHTKIDNKSIEDNILQILSTKASRQESIKIKRDLNSILEITKYFISLYSNLFEMSQNIRLSKNVSKKQFLELTK